MPIIRRLSDFWRFWRFGLNNIIAGSNPGWITMSSRMRIIRDDIFLLKTLLRIDRHHDGEVRNRQADRVYALCYRLELICMAGRCMCFWSAIPYAMAIA